MPDTAEILNFLDCQPGPPGIRALNRLIRAYIQKVPWESVFRIAKRAVTAHLPDCPRWPEEFWADAIHFGGGGTCYETNYAFFSLLQSMGYGGYLTVNDMGSQRGCHAALVITLHGQKYLVDVGIPLLCAIPIAAGRATRRGTWLHTYTVQPDGADRYQVLRSRHPKPNIYTLLDTPVGEAEYRQVVEHDYGEDGLFLDRVIVVKVIGEQLWRFNSLERPYRLEWFGQADRGEIPAPPERIVETLADRFQMDAQKIGLAFRVLER